MKLKSIIKNCLPYGLIKHLKPLRKRNVPNICEKVFANINVIVFEEREQTINILFYGTIKDTISAGPLSVLYFANFLCEMGLNVRLLFGSHSVSEKQIRINISKFDSRFDNFCKHAEIKFLKFLETDSIEISPKDITVATYWSTAFYAKRIQSYCNNKKFIYFIQDDERIFYENGTEHVLVENTYNMNFYGFFSTELLRQHFLQENIGGFRDKNIISISQNSPSYYKLPAIDVFMKRAPKKRFVFYARSGRNCCVYAEYIIKECCKKGILTNDWEIIGLAAEESKKVEIENGIFIHLQKTKPLKTYINNLYTYDVALILMESPHYSMLPIDLALSACIVVTNIFKTKTKEALSNISANIIGTEFNVESMLESIKLAVSNSENLENRYKNAIEANFPTIDNIFNDNHKIWITNILKDLKL